MAEKEHQEKKLRPLKMKKLPLKEIKPRGWLRAQLRLQAEGLTGHIEEIWEDLGPRNRWLGGDIEGWERGPYYADGLVPLAYLLEDEELMEKAEKWVEAFLGSQREDGWIGPVSGEGDYQDYDPWPNFVVLKALREYFRATEDERALETMEGFCRYLKENLDERPLFRWGKFRWADLALSIYWLYERREEEWLLQLAERVREQGYDWEKHFAEFPYKAPQPADEMKMETHVVNNAMGIKAPGMGYRLSEDEGDLKALYQGLTQLDKFHGQVTGLFTGDEHFGGRDPSRGTELCAVVEYLFSLEELLEVTADSELADRLERIAFNALPATFKPDMWAHQYDQQANQVICDVSEKIWSNAPDANIFGLEPNYGCCTANMHQGWPKFAASLWMKTGDEGEGEGLAAVSYSPCRIDTSLGGREVGLEVDTDYPFSEEIELSLHLEEPISFPLHLRIPRWSQKPEIVSPRGELFRPAAGDFYELEEKWRDGDRIRLALPAPLEAERRFRGAVALKRGPLVYALPLKEEWKLIGGEPPHGDWEVHPKEAWNYGLKLDPDRPSRFVSVNRGKLEEEKRPFSPGTAPISLKVKGGAIPDWILEDNRAGPIPSSPVVPSAVAEEKDLCLIPYGCTNLRVTEFPLIDLD